MARKKTLHIYTEEDINALSIADLKELHANCLEVINMIQSLIEPLIDKTEPAIHIPPGVRTPQVSYPDPFDTNQNPYYGGVNLLGDNDPNGFPIIDHSTPNNRSLAERQAKKITQGSEDLVPMDPSDKDYFKKIGENPLTPQITEVKPKQKIRHKPSPTSKAKIPLIAGDSIKQESMNSVQAPEIQEVSTKSQSEIKDES